MTQQQAMALLREHVKNENLIKHMIAAESVMKALAKKFEQDQEKWALAGLLHDIDWEETADDPLQHSIVSQEYLKIAGVDDDIIRAIYVHNHLHGIEPQTIFEKALYCAEELTGLIVACALVQPDKKLASVTAESVLKKFKNLAFARGVDRDLIVRCQELLGMTLEELVALELEAMKNISDDLGL
ncbi:MAG TPA: HDIG domain-containing protein [Patescibacteria group bacterium]|nr:HDIG domain-containing protein [Patescibacteria group bacterium]